MRAVTVAGVATGCAAAEEHRGLLAPGIREPSVILVTRTCFYDPLQSCCKTHCELVRSPDLLSSNRTENTTPAQATSTMLGTDTHKT